MIYKTYKIFRRFEIFTNNIAIIHKGIQQIKNDVMKHFNLKGNQGLLLFYLLKYPNGLCVSELSERIKIDKAAVSRALSELYKKELIYYPEFAGSKKYNTPALLTEKGKQITAELDDIIYKKIVEISLTNIDDEERNIMYHALRSIAYNISKSTE